MYDTQLTTQPPVNPHTVTTLPCRHITGKPLTITGCSRYCSLEGGVNISSKYSMVFDPQCQVKCCCVRLMLLSRIISLGCDVKWLAEQLRFRYDRCTSRKDCNGFNATHVCSRQPRQNNQTKQYRSLKAHPSDYYRTACDVSHIT